VKKITYIDACILIAAFKARGESGKRALEILDDNEREYASSPFLKLEVLPKPTYFKRSLEVKFYDRFFDNVSHWANDLDSIVELAHEKASGYGLAAMDSLHLASALSAGAEEFITGEKESKPIHRVQEIKIICIRE